MPKENYTPEQVTDIEERVKEANAVLEKLQLCVGAMLSKVNLGDDVFGDKVVCYLQDKKYAATPSPFVEKK